MPQLDPAVFPTQIFWLVVTFVPLYLILWRVVLPRIGDVLQSRQRHIDADLEKAASLREEAEKVLAEYEKGLAEARQQASATVKAAADQMAEESAKRHSAFAAELSEKTAEAEGRIAAAKQEAMDGLRAVATEVAEAAAAKLIGMKVSGDQAEKAVASVMKERG